MTNNTNRNQLTSNDGLEIVITKPQVDMMLVQKKDIKNIKKCLDGMKFPSFDIDIPSILYGAGISCLVSFFVLSIQKDSAEASANLFVSIVCFIVGFLASRFENFSSNVINNKKEHEHASDQLEQILNSCDS